MPTEQQILYPSSTFLRVCRKSKPIRETKQEVYNSELIEYAKGNGYFFPEKHFVSSVNLEQLNNDFQKFDTNRPWYPNEKQLALTQQVFRKLFDPDLMGSRVKTPEEAIVDSKKSSSSGFLYKQMGCKNRREVFEKFTPLLIDLIEKIRDGEQVETVWESAPKVEIRALLKLLNPDLSKRKVRTFLCCDTLCYLVGIMLYSDQNDRLVALGQRGSGWSAVGSSIFHGGWHAFASTLLDSPEVPKILAYDISAMEASISAALFVFLYEWRNEAIVGEDELKHWFLANKIFSKVIDPMGVLGFKTGANPSGCINTLTDNTFIVILCLLYHLVGREMLALAGHPLFDEKVISAVEKHYMTLPVKAMGDDTIMQDNPIWEGLEKSTLEIGFSFEKELPPSGNFPMVIHEAKFLNFGFKFNWARSMWFFVPNFDKLFAGLFYFRKSNSWRLTLAKLYALRVMCFMDVARRNEIESYIQLIWQDFDSELRAEKILKDSNGDELLPYCNLKSMYLTVPQIEFLIFGLESPSEVVPLSVQLMFRDVSSLDDDVSEIFG